jgi:OMF family outer membrane factor
LKGGGGDGLDEAKAHTRPTVTAQGSTTWQGAESTATGQGSTYTPQVSTSLTMPLDISHQLQYGKDIATYQYQSQYLAMVSTAEQLVLSVKSAYFDLLRAVGQRNVAQAAVDNAQAQLTQTTAKFDAGTIPAFDVTSAEVNLANLQQQLLVADNQVRIAQTAFNRVLGIDVNTPIQIRGVDITVTNDAIDIPQRIQEAYARRPEVQAAQLGITQAQTSVNLQSSAKYPTISIGTGPTYNFNSNGINPGLSWQVSINASVPLYDGGQIRAKVRQAKADVQTSQETLLQTQLTVAQDVRTAALNVQQDAERTKTTARAVTLAEEAVNLAKLRYGAGLAVLVEVTNAETQLTQARNNAVNALYDYAVASAHLQRATSTQPELAALQPTADSTKTQR